MSTILPDNTVHTSTMVELLRQRALTYPARIAYTFLRQSSMSALHWTYADVDRKARMIAGFLQHRGVKNQPVLLLHQSGLEYIAAFFGCLYAQALAVPAYPPHSSRSMPRIQAMIADTQAQFVLTTADSQADLQRYFSQAGEHHPLQWIATDTLDESLADEWQDPGSSGDTLAFLQYTSGSTSMPKGVMVSHHNLLSNLSACHRLVPLNADGHMVSWLPPYHDMGLIGGILYPLYEGAPATLMAPVTFLQRPLRWLETISNCHATISVAPTFAYDLCCRKITPEQRATLDLTSWQVAVCGAEPIRYETLRRFTETFAPCGLSAQTFLPGYGLAESTLIVCDARSGKEPVVRSFDAAGLAEHRVVPSQSESALKLLGNDAFPGEQTLAIVDPTTAKPCEPGQVGEIWLAGPCIARGYWQRPEETAETFDAYLADTETGPFMRTGDLGFLYEGALFITGRLKDVIILQGRNHYPQDIELTVERCHPAIRQNACAAFAIEESGEELLAILIEIDPRYRPGKENTSMESASENRQRLLDGDKLVRIIRQALSEEQNVHAHRIVLVKAGSVLKTSSGKLQRRASRAAFLRGELTLWGE